MNCFQVTKDSRRVHIREGSPEYHLEIALPIFNEDGTTRRRTKVDIFGGDGPGNRRVRITDRPVEEYAIDPEQLTIDPALQYLECGPGLGGFAQHWYEHSTAQSPPLIAIDVADFGRIHTLLSYAIQEGTAPEAEEWLEILIGRCDLLLSDNIRLMRMSLKEAQQKQPELRGLADVVIDNNGPMLYAHTEFRATGGERGERFVAPWEYAREVECSFLKPQGRYLSHHSSSDYSTLRKKWISFS
ncbi:MAG TPA: hypothetical protein VJI15_05635 [Candidatus Nanoarchaeia archaeon]|nr:hypothetical protein [Candidatus Nanoarchaeia archaeon]